MRKRAFKIRREHARELLEEAIHEYAYFVNVDHLPPGTIRRRPTDKSIWWVIKHVLESKHNHFAFIERDGLLSETNPYFDVGCSSMASDTDYFLWIRIPIEAGENLVEKYQLEQMQ